MNRDDKKEPIIASLDYFQALSDRTGEKMFLCHLGEDRFVRGEDFRPKIMGRSLAFYPVEPRHKFRLIKGGKAEKASDGDET